METRVPGPVYQSSLPQSVANGPPTIVEALYSYEIGGGERVATDAALGFARRGYRVLCVGMYGKHGPLRDELEAHGLPCIDFDYTSRWRLTRRFSYGRELARFLRREQVVALHMHYGTSLIIAGRAASRAQVPRVVMTEHALHQYQERADYAAATAAAAKFAHAITVVDPAQAEYMASSMGIPRDQLHYVPNGVRIPAEHAPHRPKLRKSLGVRDEDFVVAAIGRLHETKDLPSLIAAFAQATRQLPNRALRLWLIGDGPDRARIETAIRQHECTARVEFLGARSDIPRLLGAIDMVAMSSKTEGLPMALIEAMAYRVPCAATAVGGIPRLLADEAGLIVPPSDSSALANAIAAIATSGELRARLVERALKRVRESHDIETSVTKYLALLGLPPRWPS